MHDDKTTKGVQSLWDYIRRPCDNMNFKVLYDGKTMKYKIGFANDNDYNWMRFEAVFDSPNNAVEYRKYHAKVIAWFLGILKEYYDVEAEK